MKATTFAVAYKALLLELYNRGTSEKNERTGEEIRLLEGAWAFKLDMTNCRLPIAGCRRFFPRVAAAETAWQFLGTQDPTFIMGHAPKLWGKFIEQGQIETSYGFRWRHRFGRDQLKMMVKELKANPTNRQLYVGTWDPSVDGLGGLQPPNVPCIVGFTVSRHRNRLHMSVHLRSSDVVLGLPYDVMSYALTLDAIASEVDEAVMPGTMSFTLAHPHYYMRHNTAVHMMSSGGNATWLEGVEPQLPCWPMSAIEKDPEGYVAFVSRISKRVPFPTYAPDLEVVV